jgi:hypothetical protein
MKPLLKGAAISLIVLALFAPPAPAQNIELSDADIDVDQGVDWSRYKTYGYVEPQRGGAGVSDGHRQSQADSAIQKVVLDSLDKKGYRLAMEAPPDFFIGYDVVVYNERDRQASEYVETNRFKDETIQVVRQTTTFDSGNLRMGYISIFVVDGESHHVVWRGTVNGRSTKPPKSVGPVARSAAERIMAEFPPAT